ncbi:hypothetical protein INS49_004979 [Diaporthe citri]|uniref:uncharacterized protein n=1 Tax=Diaporthe citri TaxID=83186 RepID=UPI001C81B6C2|nr:uncharacterized protein INS49_004979 [Diaporthe citri]KAG6354008.1 hypothetical protein INS49_004979 [Diaporthe citri]
MTTIKTTCYDPIFSIMDSYWPICLTKTFGFNDENGILPMGSVSAALTENPRNGALTLPPAPQLLGGSQHLAMMTGKFWRPGRELNIGFQGGSSWQKDQVKTYAPQWTQYANLNFTFVDSGGVDILIAFKPDSASWSLMGTDSSLASSQNQTSMNLGWIEESNSEDGIRSVILHEFGHALGMIHEHQNPYANISWNKDKVYKDLCGPRHNWTKAEVDYNIFPLTSDTQASAFDPDSIMLYQIPDEWTTDGKGTSNNVVDLSALDMEYVKFCYPADTYDAGQFNTMEIRPEDKPQLVNDKVNQAANISITAATSEATTENFKASLHSWADTVLYSASMTYLEKSSAFNYTQTGVYNTQETRPWNEPQLMNSKRINFTTPFSAPPKVVTWLQSLDMDKSKNWRIIASATDIDKNGFTIHADSWADSILYSAGVTWLAHPAEQPGVTSGRIDTQDVRPWQKPQHENSGVRDFGVAFSGTPKVIMALDSLDYDHSRNLRVRLSTSFVNSTSMTWHLESWWDSIMYSAGASFFAWT